MPFKSEAQRKFLWAKHPKIAEAWSHGKSSVTGKKEFTPKNSGLKKVVSHIKESKYRSG